MSMNGGYRGYGAMAVGTPSSGMSMQQISSPPVAPIAPSGGGAPSIPDLAAPTTPGATLTGTGLTASALAPGGIVSSPLYTPQSMAQSHVASPQGAQQASMLQSVLNPFTRSTAGTGIGVPQGQGIFPGVQGAGPLPEEMADAAALETILDQISDSVASNLQTSFSYATDDLVEADEHGHIIDHDEEEWDEHGHLVYHEEDEDLLEDYALPHPSLRGGPVQDLAGRIRRSKRGKKSKFGGQKKPCECSKYGALNAPSQGGYFGDSVKIGAGLALGVVAVATAAMVLSKAIK